MPKLKGVLLISTLALGLPIIAQAQTVTAETETATIQVNEVTSDTVIATVGNVTITIGHIIAAVQDLDQEEQKLPDDVLLNGLAERLIQQAAFSQTVTELSKSTKLRLENERHALIADEVINARALAINVGEEDLKAAYDARFTTFTPPTEYNASHILVETEEEAKSLVEQLQGGADFVELAKEKSTGPSGPSGGNLGWFVRGNMVEQFQDAVETLEAGSVSAPVQTQFGWHVIKLNETRVPNIPTFEEMSGELQGEVFQKLLRQEMDDMIEAAGVVRTDAGPVDAAIVRDTSLIEQ